MRLAEFNGHCHTLEVEFTGEVSFVSVGGVDAHVRIEQLR
jgi:hypothetical protein